MRTGRYDWGIECQMVGTSPAYSVPTWYRAKRVDTLLRACLPDVDLRSVMLVQCIDVGFLVTVEGVPVGFIDSDDGRLMQFTKDLPVPLLVGCFGFGALAMLSRCSEGQS